MITSKQIERIVCAIAEQRNNYESDGKHATAIGVSDTAYSFIKSGQYSKIAEKNWLRIARELGVQLEGEAWKAAKTTTYLYITAQLEACQKGHINKAFCDLPDIGKTFTATLYAKSHKNVALIDCSVFRTRNRLIRRIARQLGIEADGAFYKVRDNMVEALKTLKDPLVILDEAGDISMDALRELKGLINETGDACAWYFMGADGFRSLYERSIRCERLGFAEMFSRMGGEFCNLSNNREVAGSADEFKRQQVAAVASLNFAGDERKRVEAKAQGSLRSLRNSYRKTAL